MLTPGNGRRLPLWDSPKVDLTLRMPTTISRPGVGGLVSGPRLTTPDMETQMIWQEEVRRIQRKREWVAFYTGCVFTALTILLVVVFVVKLTGGVTSCP